MIYQIKSYIKFLLRSTNQHGVHSPFVYDLVTKCFYNRSGYPEYSILKKYRRQLYESVERIEITDFGAGSRVFKSDERQVASIAKNAGITTKRQQLLFRIMKYFDVKTALELGTSLGLATAAMALSNEKACIMSVEGCPNTAKIASRMFNNFGLSNIMLHVSTFEDFFATETTSEKYDLVYIDGNHNQEKTLQYFEILLNHVKNNSVLLFDDIYWSKQMTEAWQEIIKHPKVTVSIDTFYWGLVFFRSEQKKQHFSIRM